MVSLPHPIQYQGSKRNLASDILTFLPRKVDRLIEPFTGTAAISVAAAAKNISQCFWLNDLNQPLSQLLELIIQSPHEIINAYTEIWNAQHQNSVAHYFEIREQFNLFNDPKLFLYLLARCVKGSVRYNADGRFNQSPDKRRKGTHPDKMTKNIKGVSALLNGKCKFTSLDYREILEQANPYDFIYSNPISIVRVAQASSLFGQDAQPTNHLGLLYLDPPYQGVCGKRDARYFAGIDINEFIHAIDDLNRRNIPFAISYDGRRGDKTFGIELPQELGLQKIELEVGRSSSQCDRPPTMPIAAPDPSPLDKLDSQSCSANLDNVARAYREYYRVRDRRNLARGAFWRGNSAKASASCTAIPWK